MEKMLISTELYWEVVAILEAQESIGNSDCKVVLEKLDKDAGYLSDYLADLGYELV